VKQPWTKGGPSPNPAGRGIAKAAARGTTDVVAYAGFIASGERHGDLTGSRKWLTYSESYNTPVVATGIRYFGNLLSGTEWHIEENKAGGKGARKGVDIVEQGLIQTPMLRPWSSVVRKAAMYRLLGFSLHATSMRRRPDGMIVYSEIEHRPQHSIERWLRKDERAPFDAVIQRTRQSGLEIEIPLDECFYCVDDTLADSPDGVGLLRHVIEHVRRLAVLEKMEGSALVRDMGGTPLGRAPIAEIVAQLGTSDAATVQTQIDAATLALRTVMVNRNKTPEEAMYLLLDSSTYKNPDGTPTAIAKWALEIVRSETANMGPTDIAIRRVELQIARVLGIEFALMGADSSGSYAMHDDKTSTFETNIQTTLNELGWFATMQLGRRLVARNGLDPDTCAPRLVAEPISTDAVETACRSLALITQAGLMPDDPATDVLRGRLRLPPQPERIEIESPRAPAALDPDPEIDDTEDPTGAEDLLDEDDPETEEAAA